MAIRQYELRKKAEQKKIFTFLYQGQ